jgi:hypothetical protein
MSLAERHCAARSASQYRPPPVVSCVGQDPRLFGREVRAFQVNTEDARISANDGIGRVQCKSDFFVAVRKQEANGSVKLAVLLLNGCDLEAATSILDHAGGQLRAALTAIGKPCPDPADLTQVEAPEMY